MASKELTNAHPPASPENADEKHSAHDDKDLNREAFEEIAQCAAIGEISEYAVTIEGEEQTTWFVWLLVCCCTISGLLFGKSFKVGGERCLFDDLFVLQVTIRVLFLVRL